MVEKNKDKEVLVMSVEVLLSLVEVQFEIMKSIDELEVDIPDPSEIVSVIKSNLEIIKKNDNKVLQEIDIWLQ